MPTFLPIVETPTLTDELFKAIEEYYHWHLPNDYRAFLITHNGAFPSPDCVLFDEAGQTTASNVFCFFAWCNEPEWLSIDWQYAVYSERIPNSTFPIARDSMGNLWLISVRSEDSGAVHFWDCGSYDTFDETDLANWPRVAQSFDQFLKSLRNYDPWIETLPVPSRYSLIKQANDGMVNSDASFCDRASPEYMWHCECSDDGNIRMQLVPDAVHAPCTHTCGYSRLRAINGLIKSRPTRLPSRKSG